MTPLKDTDIRKGFWLEALLWALVVPFMLMFGFRNPTFLLIIGIFIIMLQNMKDRKVSKIGLFIVSFAVFFAIVEIMA